MRGFTNKFPFFEDLDLRVKENRLNPRTRMELNTAYQDNLSGNPGSSSLVKAINEENKLIEVTVIIPGTRKRSLRPRRQVTAKISVLFESGLMRSLPR